MLPLPEALAMPPEAYEASEVSELRAPPLDVGIEIDPRHRQLVRPGEEVTSQKRSPSFQSLIDPQ